MIGQGKGHVYDGPAVGQYIRQVSDLQVSNDRGKPELRILSLFDLQVVGNVYRFNHYIAFLGSNDIEFDPPVKLPAFF